MRQTAHGTLAPPQYTVPQTARSAVGPPPWDSTPYPGAAACGLAERSEDASLGIPPPPLLLLPSLSLYVCTYLYACIDFSLYTCNKYDRQRTTLFALSHNHEQTYTQGDREQVGGSFGGGKIFAIAIADEPVCCYRQHALLALLSTT